MNRGAGLWVGISVLWIPLAFLFDGVTVLMLPVRLGADATTLGLVSMIGLGVAAGLQPVAGWLSDRLRGRFDRRSFLAVSAIPAIAGLWLLVGTTGLVAAVAGYLLVQAAGACMQAAQQALVPEHLEAPRQGRASGLRSAFDVGGSFLAFALLGGLMASGRLALAGVLIGALLVVAVVLVLALVPGRQARPGRRPTWRIPDGLRSLVVARFLFLLATYGVGRFLVFLVAERLGLDPDRAVADAGGLLALFTLVTAILALPAGWAADRRSRRDLMLAGALISALGIAVLAPAAGLPGLVVGGVLMSAGTAVFVTANWAAMTSLTAAPAAGRLLGIANLGTGVAAATAGAFGPLIDASGFGVALLAAAAVSAAAVVPLVVNPGPLGRPTESPA